MQRDRRDPVAGRPTGRAHKGAETRRQLLTGARELFGSRGFAETGTEELVARAEVTRGALYYHFVDKTALFDAVVVEIAGEVLAAIERAADRETDPIDSLLAGCRAYLDACLAPPVRRIYVVDAPSVLGTERIREIDAAHAQGSLRSGIDAVLEAHPTKRVSAPALTALLSGALDEAVLWLLGHDAPESRRQLDATLAAMIRRTLDR